MELEKFRSKVASQGLAKSSKWVVQVFPPRGITATGKVLSDLLSTGGNRLEVNLPILDALDDTVNAINDLQIDLGGFSVNYNPEMPTLGYAVANQGEFLESLSLFAQTVTIPGRDIQEVEYREAGEARSVGFMHTHEGTLDVTYYCSEDLREKKYFEEWQKIIFNKDNVGTGYYNDYISRVDVIKYNSSFSKKTATYRFNECYPTNIAGFELNSEGDGLLQLVISFKFRNYERIEE